MTMIVYAVFGSMEEAHRIGRAMIDERLAACVNILAPCASIYRWAGVVAEAAETPALFKTRGALAEPLIARIAALHGYELPAITAWPAQSASPGLSAWIDDATTNPGD